MKKIILMFFMAFSAIMVNAQTAIQSSKIFDNTYIGIDGGVATPLSFDGVFPLNPTVTLRVGKLFSPVFGAEIEGTGWFGSHADYLERFDGDGGHNVIRGSYVGLNGTANLTNLFLGYNGKPRKVELSVVAGTGWVHTYIPYHNDKYENFLGAKTGLDIAFNIDKNRAHTINIRPAVLWNLSVPGNAVSELAFNKRGAQLYLGVGYTYHFKTSNGTHYFKTYDIGAFNDEINRLREEVAKKPKEVIKEVVVEKVVEKTVETTWFVQFAKGSYELTEEAKATLDSIGENLIVDVIGTASPEGSKKFNQKLSEERAKVVADYLENRGVRVNSSEGKGVQIGLSTNRLAIITITK